MKPIAILGAGLVALASSSGGFGGPPRSTPRPPPSVNTPPRQQPGPFKPFHGTHVDSTRGGVDAFPHAPKSKWRTY